MAVSSLLIAVSVAIYYDNNTYTYIIINTRDVGSTWISRAAEDEGDGRLVANVSYRGRYVPFVRRR